MSAWRLDHSALQHRSPGSILPARGPPPARALGSHPARPQTLITPIPGPHPSCAGPQPRLAAAHCRELRASLAAGPSARGASKASSPRGPPGGFIAPGGGGRAFVTARGERPRGRRRGRRASTCITRPDSPPPGRREGALGREPPLQRRPGLEQLPRGVASAEPPAAYLIYESTQNSCIRVPTHLSKHILPIFCQCFLITSYNSATSLSFVSPFTLISRFKCSLLQGAFFDYLIRMIYLFSLLS